LYDLQMTVLSWIRRNQVRESIVDLRAFTKCGVRWLRVLVEEEAELISYSLT
jgi:hypothetical protein